MENLTLEQLLKLAQQSQDPSISIYLPTHCAGPDTQQDPIRFKNLVRRRNGEVAGAGHGRTRCG